MKKFFQTKPNPESAELLLRLGIGVFVLLAGISKFQMGVSNFVKSTASGFESSFLPMSLVNTFLTVLPFLETILALLLITGFLRRWALLGTGLLLIVFIFGLTVNGNPDASLFVYLFVVAFALSLPGGFCSSCRSDNVCYEEEEKCCEDNERCCEKKKK
ncbi:DoxX family protein [Candidatus Peregrinibacteria bacterium]|nr:DoxX family protein [Candidatus Peregrinibacteria bacterium]